MKLRDLGEFGLIERIERLARADDAKFLVTFGEDAAAYDLGDGRALILTVDASLEGTHFRLDTGRPEDVGYRATAAALSDVAAMGGRPSAVLMTFGAPPDLDAAVAESVATGVRDAARDCGAALVGGDCVTSPLGMIVALACIGEGQSDHLLRRRGAQPGDRIIVTGDLGDSAAGRMVAERPDLELAEDVRQYLLRRHFRPQPRVAAGRVLAEHEAVHAAIDVSDGLLQDLGHICRVNRVGARLFADAVPVSRQYRAAARLLPVQEHELPLGGGEDYELVATVDPDAAEAVCEAVWARGHVECVMVGVVTAGDTIQVLDEAGYPLEAIPAGWEHFRG